MTPNIQKIIQTVNLASAIVSFVLQSDSTILLNGNNLTLVCSYRNPLQKCGVYSLLSSLVDIPYRSTSQPMEKCIIYCLEEVLYKCIIPFSGHLDTKTYSQIEIARSERTLTPRIIQKVIKLVNRFRGEVHCICKIKQCIKLLLENRGPFIIEEVLRLSSDLAVPFGHKRLQTIIPV